MPSLIYFGRAGLPTASGGDGMSLYRGEFECEGDEATVDLLVRGQSSANDAKALRDQLLGYHLNTDEPVIPIVDNADSSRTGFWRVLRVKQVPELTGREGSSTAGIAYRLTAELLRVPGWQAPLFEIVSAGALRANAHAIATGTSIAWGSPGVNAYGVSFTTSPSTATARDGEEGDVIVYTGGTNAMYGTTMSWYVAPTDFYKGSARLQVSADSGSTWRTVIGRQMANLPTYWRLSNSLVRLTSSATPNKAEFTVQWFDGTQWETAKTFRHTAASGTFVELAEPPVAAVVVRSGLECQTVRVVYATAGVTGTTFASVDYTLRRGSRTIEINTGSDVAAIALTSAEAFTSLTAGGRATANDAGGNKLVLASTDVVALDVVGGKIESGSNNLAVTMAIGGTTGNGFDQTQGLIYEYMAAIDQRQRVVAR